MRAFVRKASRRQLKRTKQGHGRRMWEASAAPFSGQLTHLAGRGSSERHRMCSPRGCRPGRGGWERVVGARVGRWIRRARVSDSTTASRRLMVVPGALLPAPAPAPPGCPSRHSATTSPGMLNQGSAAGHSRHNGYSRQSGLTTWGSTCQSPHRSRAGRQCLGCPACPPPVRQ